MTEPKKATTAATGQRYYAWRSEKYWSVTTILGGGIPKRALINWAANEVANYVCDNLATVAPLIESDRDGAYDLLKRAPWRKKEKAAELGTDIHAAVEAYILGKPFPTWGPLVRPRMLGFEKFLARYQPTYELTEASVFNRAERYAGTLDAILTLGAGPWTGRKVLLDLKSGKGVYAETGLQLAAYRYAEFVGAPDGSEQPVPEVDAAVVLHIPEVGECELLEVQADQEMFSTFKYAREVFRFVEQTSKEVVRGPVPYVDAAQEALPV